MRVLSSILSLSRNEFNKFNKTGAWLIDSIYHMILKVFFKSYCWREKLGFCHMHDVKTLISQRYPKICKH